MLTNARYAQLPQIFAFVSTVAKTGLPDSIEMTLNRLAVELSDSLSVSRFPECVYVTGMGFPDMLLLNGLRPDMLKKDTSGYAQEEQSVWSKDDERPQATLR